MKRIIATCVLLAVLVLSVQAKDWYVSPQGNDAASGSSPSTALRTLQKAADLVAPGDRVLLCSGDFTMEGRSDDKALVTITKSGTKDAWITWRPAPGAKPVIRPSGWAAFDVRGSYHIFEDLVIIGQNDRLTLKGGIEDSKKQMPTGLYNTNGITIEGRQNAPDSKPHHHIIRRCTIAKCAGGGVAALETDYLTVEDCLVYDNCWYMRYAGSGITTLNSWAYDNEPGYHVIIRRNKVWNNRTLVPWGKTGKLSDGNGILLDVTNKRGPNLNNPDGDATVQAQKKKDVNAESEKKERPDWTNYALIENNISAFNGGSGIHVFRTCNVHIVNNTTYWNGSVVDYAELFSNASNNIVIMNNVIIPRPGGQVNSNYNNKDVVWDYNIYPMENPIVKGPHDIVADPKLVNPGKDISKADFRPQAKSPVIDAGTKEKAPAHDINGKKRPSGKAVDMGAIER